MIKGHENDSISQLNALCTEVRESIVKAVESNGGHIASNLGAVELTIALHQAMQLPQDKLLFDVGHQAYCHKLLSGRDLSSLRKQDGISGFCDIKESEYDSYGSGHSGSAVAAARGMCAARDLLKEKHKIAVVLGDGALTSGETLEALNGLQEYKGQLLLVLNDNGMSISVGSGGFYKHLSRMTLRKGYRLTKSKWKKSLAKNTFGRECLKAMSTIKRFVKRTSGGCNIFEEMGIKYVGALDGHNLSEMLGVLPDLLNCEVPVLLHLKTVKGKGYAPAEENPEKYHSVSVDFEQNENTFAESLGYLLAEEKLIFPNMITVTAAMNEGTGVAAFARVYPESSFDVGICEQTAVSFACGAAISGLKPIVFIYSTFMQRAYDQIQQEVCLQNLPVVLCLDRAGFVGRDGKTHQGFYDIAMLRSLPNIHILAPASIEQLAACIRYGLKRNGPTAIRYPNGNIYLTTAQVYLEGIEPHFSVDKWQLMLTGEGKTVILAVGPRMLNEALKAAGAYGNIEDPTVYNCTSVRPLDRKVLDSITDKHIITMEEGVYEGGFGSAVAEYYSDRKIHVNLSRFAVTDVNLPPDEIYKQIRFAGLDHRTITDMNQYILDPLAKSFTTKN